MKGKAEEKTRWRGRSESQRGREDKVARTERESERKRSGRLVGAAEACMVSCCLEDCRVISKSPNLSSFVICSMSWIGLFVFCINFGVFF